MANCYITGPDNVKLDFTALVSINALQDCYNLNDTTLKPADLYLMPQALKTL